MKGRLELGCLVMIVGTAEDPNWQRQFVGLTGRLTFGPYQHPTGEVWDMHGPELPLGELLAVNSSCLVRIDDPDVELDEQTSQPNEVAP